MNTKTKLSSEWIYKFYKEQEKYGIENHGLILEKGGEILYEEYSYPYCAEMPHTLFSVTKSVVSTAAGFAVDEGLVSLDSKILPLFPEYKACESSEWDSLTLRSVLTMSSNKEFSFLQDMTGDYVEMFMKAPFRKEKGFLYSNNDAHMVAAIIQKLSGMNLVDYLTPRLFEPLGIEPPQWETDEKGDCIGGTGAYLKLRDLVKIMRCYADGGKYNGVQVIPEGWTKEATKRQVVLSGRDDEDGYGFLFWTHNGVVSMNGMYGQQISYFPESDTIVAAFNCIVKDKSNNYLIKNVLPKAFDGEASPEWDERLADYLKSRGEKPFASKEVPKISAGKIYRITPFSDACVKIMFPASVIPRSLTASMAKRPDKNIDNVCFSLDDKVLVINWTEGEDAVTVNCGLDGNPRMSECSLKGYRYKIWAYAYCENGIVYAVVKPLNTLATQRIKIELSDNVLKMQFKDTPSFSEFILHNAGQSSFVSNSGKLRPFIDKTVKTFMKTIENPVKFKAK